MRATRSLPVLLASFLAASPALAQRPSDTPRTLDGIAWRAIGPAAFGGRIDDVEAVASDPRTIFVASASGGIFRSTNDGTTWDAVFDRDGTALSIGDIAIAPSDPKVVWAGSGEPNNRQSSTWGDGVYRSTDGGTTWTNMGLRETQSIGRIVIAPRDPNTVFVAALGHLFGPNEERGLYRTTDGGATWKKVLGVDENTGVVDVALDPDGRTLYAATYQRRRRAWGFSGSGPGSALWRSLDGGETWEKLTKGLPTGNTGRIGIAIAASSPNVVYAIIEHREGGVFRSDDRGATWTRQSRRSERASYYSQIRVDPRDPSHVWMLATALYESTDGGKTFESEGRSDRVHADEHALWIDPARPGHMMIGTDGGLYITDDGAHRWRFVDNLPISQFYHVAVDPREPYWIYGGAQDNGSWAIPSRTFQRGGMTNGDVMNTGYADGFQAAVDQRDPRWIYTNSQGGRAFLFDMLTRRERWIPPVPDSAGERYRFNWNTPILASRLDSSAVYYGGNRLFRTRDRGTTWHAISPDLTRNIAEWRKLPMGSGFPERDATTLSRDDGVSAYGTITTIDESRLARGTIVVGTDDGRLQLTTDGGARWTDLTPRITLPGPRWVSAVVASRHAARTLYAAFDGHYDDDIAPYVFRSTDGGATWTSIAGDLPRHTVVRALAEDPHDASLLYAGTEFGLYWSFDGGRHWRLAEGGIPRVRVDWVLVNDRANDLVVATHGRGIYILDDLAPFQGGDPALAREPARLFPVRRATEMYVWRDLPWPGANAFLAPNPPEGALISYRLGGGRDSARVRVLASDGKVVREMAVPGGEGTHRVVWDMRRDVAFVPPPQDSGLYGAPQPPLVTPGRYSVQLLARGLTLTQPVEVRADPRAPNDAAALRARAAIVERVVALSARYAEGAKAFADLDSEVTRIAKAVRAQHSPPAALDSAVRAVGTRVASLRGSFRSEYPTPIGRAFDVLGALESAAGSPSDAMRRTLDQSAAALDRAIREMREIEAKGLPSLRALAGER